MCVCLCVCVCVSVCVCETASQRWTGAAAAAVKVPQIAQIASLPRTRGEGTRASSSGTSKKWLIHRHRQRQSISTGIRAQETNREAEHERPAETNAQVKRYGNPARLICRFIRGGLIQRKGPSATRAASRRSSSAPRGKRNIFSPVRRYQ